MTGLRFGIVSESVRPGRAWLDYARQIEDAGIGVLLIRDHFSAAAFGQQLAPFTALASAAAVTTRLRLGTLVLSNDFRHPAIVAHEAASLHLVSAGRFDLGLGAGWYQPEYAAAGIGFDPAGQRISRLEESLGIIRALLAGEPVRHEGTWYQVNGLDLDVLPERRSSPRRSRTRPTATTRGTGCPRRSTPRSPCSGRRPVTGSRGWNSTRSAPSS
jgi:alkanesulfonate monooxygenase SsuD/methylene tetrahydromethanopterin reductase-like flavin-dependent oxidoreductase (luciferase family)